MRWAERNEMGGKAKVKGKKMDVLLPFFIVGIVGRQSLDLGIAYGLILEGFVDSLVVFVIEFPIQ